MTSRSVVRVASKVKTAEKGATKTLDSYQNFLSRVGIGTQNLQSASTYGFNPITRLRILLEWMYRGSWMCRVAVDCVAEDMMKAGIDVVSTMPPDDIDKMNAAMRRHMVWQQLCEVKKWARLYGGCVGVIMIAGQNPSTPLRVETVGKDAYKGLVVLDRWMCEPSLEDLVTELGNDLGMPKFYRVTADAPAIPRMSVHHSRVVRFEGYSLPYWQKIAENLWGLSIFENLYDRLVGFDSTTNGTTQLVNRAHLRTYAVEGLREVIAAGGAKLTGLMGMVDMMRSLQSNEGMTLIDAKDKLETQTYNFAGLSDVMLQSAQQLSGALQIPLIRLFGQAPAGLGNTGESDLRIYYDGVKTQQENTLRHPLDKVIRVVCASAGVKVPEGFHYEFRPLWDMKSEEKAAAAKDVTDTVIAANESGLISAATALKEMRQSSKITGVWSNITDEDIDAADQDPPEPNEGMLGMGGEGEDLGGADPVGKAGKEALKAATSPKGSTRGADAVPYDPHGLGVFIETRKGALRTGRGWSVRMPAHYGYLRGTSSAEGDTEELDCFVGDSPEVPYAYVVDQRNLRTGNFDEHKVILGVADDVAARKLYCDSFSGRGDDRIMGLTKISIDELRAWMPAGPFDRPYTELKNAPKPAYS